MTARAVAVGVYIAAIILANVLTDRFGLVDVGFGLVVTAGTFAAGFALLARDFVQRTSGIPVVLGAIVTGAALSWVLASPELAVASGIAFLGAELVDLAVFSGVLETSGFVVAVLVSNLIAAPVDTVLFLWIAGFPITTDVVLGQLVAKLVYATAIPLLLWIGGRRALLREPIDA